MADLTPDLVGVRIFLSAPFSQWLLPDERRVPAERRDRLDRLRLHLLARGAHVFSPHHNEAWGERWKDAEECTPADFRAMRRANAVCAVLGNPVSPGVAMELGWASAWGLAGVVIRERGGACPPLIAALGTVTPAVVVDEPAEWNGPFFAAIAGHIGRLTSATKREDVPVGVLVDAGYVLATTGPEQG